MHRKNIVSIIMPNYNCSQFIAQTIESVLAQTYSDWELIIIDDCSTDNSIQIAQAYALNDNRIKILFNEKNCGAAVSRNKALDFAQGEYIAFLDSDDLWTSDKLEKQIEFMKINNCDFCYSSYDLINEKNQPFNKRTRIPKRLSYKKLLHHDFIGCLTAIYKFDIASDIRSFNIKNNNDYGLFLQIIRRAENPMGLLDITAHYRIRTNGISRKKWKKVKPFFELMTQYLRIPFLIAIWYLLTNVLIGITWKYKKIS